MYIFVIYTKYIQIYIYIWLANCIWHLFYFFLVNDLISQLSFPILKSVIFPKANTKQMMFNYSWEFSLLIPCLEDLVKQQSMENLLECNIGFDLNLGRVWCSPVYSTYRKPDHTNHDYQYPYGQIFMDNKDTYTLFLLPYTRFNFKTVL